jgi:hypothetical protein
MCADQQIGVVGGWRYSVTQRDGNGLFVVVRRDVLRDTLEDEIAFSYSSETAEVIGAAIMAHERRKCWRGGENLST